MTNVKQLLPIGWAKVTNPDNFFYGLNVWVGDQQSIWPKQDPQPGVVFAQVSDDGPDRPFWAGDLMTIPSND